MKSKDVSNKTLSALVLVSMAVFVLGTLVSYFSAQQPGGLTGYVFANRTNENGTASLYVNGTVYMNLTDSAIAFGNMELGRALQSEDFVTTDTNGLKNGNGTGILGDFFNVSNEGSVYMNISVYFTNTSLFVTPTGSANTFPNAFFQVHGNRSDNGNQSMNVGGDFVNTTDYVNTTFGNVGTSFATRTQVIYNLDHTERNNSALIGLKVTVPADEEAGGRQVSVILIGTQGSPK